MLDAELIVAIGFAIFIGAAIYYGAPKWVAAALDKRSERIAAEIAEATMLKDEAQALLASFERKRAEAQQEAEAIVAQAHAEAERIASEAHARISEFIQRRTKQAEEKISLAESQAAAEVRAAAAEAAVKAAAEVLKGEVQGAFGNSLIDRSITQLKSRLQ
ncbi:MAG TPA: ATP F0F1 synthase subunit B [Methylocella sp.]|nr:ATP F0F1 synthase subunit B [Methylocella sp.]